MNRVLKRSLLLAGIGLLVVWGGEEFVRRKIGGLAGSYPFAESWIIPATQSQVVAAIVALKRAQPSLIPPHDASAQYVYWYYIRFRYPDTGQLVSTWLSPTADSSQTKFAFVSLSEPKDSTSYRLINRDFWYLENKLQIRKFEAQILAGVRAHLRKNASNR